MKKLIKIFIVICTVFMTSVNHNQAFGLDYDTLYEKYFKNRTLSILGDSISTYAGYSNDALNTNSSIGYNAVWFKNNNVISSVNETWWMQVINSLNMKLLVNNSYSGSEMGGNGYIRASYLHDDTGDNQGEKPDYVAIFMGVNDLNHFESDFVGDFNEDMWKDTLIINNDGTYSYKTPTTFAEAYAIAIHKIKTLYRSEVFCCTMMENTETVNKNKEDLLEEYREQILKISDYFDCITVDFNKDSKINLDTLSLYTSDGLHPNEAGMDLLTDCFLQSVKQFVLDKESSNLKDELRLLLEETQNIDEQYYHLSTYESLNDSYDYALNIYNDKNATHDMYYHAIIVLNNGLKYLQHKQFLTLKEENLINTYDNKDNISVLDYCSQSSTDFAYQVLDYNDSTIWHTDWTISSNKTLPHYISFDLKENYYLNDILFLPRVTGTNGDIFTLNVYISDDSLFDNEDYAGTYNFENNGVSYIDRSMKRIELDEVKKGRYIKIETTKTGGTTALNSFTSIAEMRFYGVREQSIIDLENQYIEYSQTDSKLYKEESYNVFKIVLDDMRDMIDSYDYSSYEIKNMKKALIDAYHALELKPLMNFPDVEEGSWYYPYVQSAFDKGLMSGMGDGTYFAPSHTLSRAMAVTILYRMSGTPDIDYTSRFSDVKVNDWHNKAVLWAASVGVVNGYSGSKQGMFGPNDSIKRQDLAVMMRNYAKKQGLDTNADADFSNFEDGKNVDGYAKDALAWCIENKIISGSEVGSKRYLNAKKNTNRAEAAKMFSILDDLIKENIK